MDGQRIVFLWWRDVEIRRLREGRVVEEVVVVEGEEEEGIEG